MEFKGNFRITYDIYKEFSALARKWQYVLLIYALLLVAGLLVSTEYFVAMVCGVIVAELCYRLTVKRVYYENQKKYMESCLVTINSKGISERTDTSYNFFSADEVLKIIEKKDCFFIFVGKRIAVCLEKRQFENSGHIGQLTEVLRQYYSHVPTKLLPDSCVNTPNQPDEEKSYYIEPIIIDRTDNKKSVIRLYIIVSLVVVIACISPLRRSEKNMENTETNPVQEDLTLNLTKEYIAMGDRLMDIQQEYKKTDKYISSLDDIYDKLEEYDGKIKYYDEVRKPENVLLYHYGNLCYNLIYIMEKPYSQLNYIEKAEYDTLISQIREYKEKIQGCTGNENGII